MQIVWRVVLYCGRYTTTVVPAVYGHLGMNQGVLIIKVAGLSRWPDYQGGLIIKVS